MLEITLALGIAAVAVMWPTRRPLPLPAPAADTACDPFGGPDCPLLPAATADSDPPDLGCRGAIAKAPPEHWLDSGSHRAPPRAYVHNVAPLRHATPLEHADRLVAWLQDGPLLTEPGAARYPCSCLACVQPGALLARDMAEVYGEMCLDSGDAVLPWARIAREINLRLGQAKTYCWHRDTAEGPLARLRYYRLPLGIAGADSVEAIASVAPMARTLARAA